MSDPTHKPDPSLDLENMELHSDISVERDHAPPVRRPVHARGWPLTVFLLVACLALGGAGTCYYLKYEEQNRAMAEIQALSENKSLDLKTMANSLADSKDRISSLEGALADEKKQTQKLDGERGRLTKEISGLKKDVSGLESDLKKAREETTKAAAEAKRLGEERDGIRDRLASVEKRANEEIATLQTQLESNRSQYATQLKRQEDAQAGLRRELDEAREAQTRIKRQFEEESQASKTIIKEISGLKSENARLQVELDRAKRQVKDAQDRINGLENVETGELVPFSGEVEAGQVRFREPLPPGLKFPRRLGQIAVQALVTEDGEVDQAFILPGQELDAEVATAVVRAVYAWKFTPPRHKTVRVKLWQTVLVTPE